MEEKEVGWVEVKEMAVGEVVEIGGRGLDASVESAEQQGTTDSASDSQDRDDTTTATWCSETRLWHTRCTPFLRLHSDTCPWCS